MGIISVKEISERNQLLPKILHAKQGGGTWGLCGQVRSGLGGVQIGWPKDLARRSRCALILPLRLEAGMRGMPR